MDDTGKFWLYGDKIMLADVTVVTAFDYMPLSSPYVI